MHPSTVPFADRLSGSGGSGSREVPGHGRGSAEGCAKSGSLGDLAGGGEFLKARGAFPGTQGVAAFQEENLDVQAPRSHPCAPAGAAATACGQSVGASTGQTGVWESEPRPFVPRSAETENLTNPQQLPIRTQNPQGCLRKGAG